MREELNKIFETDENGRFIRLTIPKSIARVYDIENDINLKGKTEQELTPLEVVMVKRYADELHEKKQDNNLDIKKTKKEIINLRKNLVDDMDKSLEQSVEEAIKMVKKEDIPKEEKKKLIKQYKQILKDYKRKMPKNEKKCLKELEPLIDKELIELGLLKINGTHKDYALGSSTVKFEITKRLMKEKYNINWQSPQDKHHDWDID